MARKRSPNRDKAYEIYKEHSGNITNRKIAELLGEDEKVIAVWKNRDKWNVVQQSEKQSCTTKKKAVSRATKMRLVMEHLRKTVTQKNMVFFASIFRKKPFRLLKKCRTIHWMCYGIRFRLPMMPLCDHNRLCMFVTGTINHRKVAEQDGNVIGEKWEVQQAWDKQANFLKAQARAQGELRGMIKQYNELLHDRWELTTDEQKARIKKLEAETERMRCSEHEGNDTLKAWAEKVLEGRKKQDE